MLKLFHTALPKISSKLIFLILAFIIIAHMVLFILYAQYNKGAEAKVNHDILVQQVTNLIERVNYTEPVNRLDVVQAVDVPNINMTLGHKPKWPLQFQENTSLWRISEAIRKQTDLIQLSLQYSPDTWLNISASTARSSWWFQIFLLSLEIVVVTAIMLSIWSINRFAMPLQDFKKAANRLGVDLDSPPLIKEYGPAIVRETAHALNQMQARIRDLIKERTHMLAALSHDLRTPITRMKLRAQFIENPELYQKTINDLDQMEAMIAEMLAFARDDAHLEQWAKLDLNSLLSSIADEFQDIGFNVTYRPYKQRILIRGRPIALKRAFNNLIENAVKYGRKADIALITKSREIMVIIQDAGPGIPESLLQKVFEPFYRGDNSRSRETGGTGLGLAVARDIVRAHGGSISLENMNQGGLRVNVKFPCY